LINKRIEQRTVAGFEAGSSFHAPARQAEPQRHQRQGRRQPAARSRTTAKAATTSNRTGRGAGTNRAHSRTASTPDRNRYARRLGSPGPIKSLDDS